MQDIDFFHKYTEFQTWVKKSFSKTRVIDLNVLKTPFSQKGLIVLFAFSISKATTAAITARKNAASSDIPYIQS